MAIPAVTPLTSPCVLLIPALLIRLVVPSIHLHCHVSSWGPVIVAHSAPGNIHIGSRGRNLEASASGRRVKIRIMWCHNSVRKFLYLMPLLLKRIEPLNPGKRACLPSVRPANQQMSGSSHAAGCMPDIINHPS